MLAKKANINSVFEKNFENKKTQRCKCGIAWCINYHTSKQFFRKLVSNTNEKKTKILMKKPVYLGLSV